MMTTLLAVTSAFESSMGLANLMLDSPDYIKPNKYIIHTDRC